MTPEELFAVVEPLRKAKQLKLLDVRRCPDGCFLVGNYEYRGQQVAIITRVKVSESKSRLLGVPRETPGRAWLGFAPSGSLVGCKHRLFTI